MADIRLDPNTHEIDLTGLRPTIVRGIDARVQSLKIRLGFYYGEWFLDQSRGIPFFQEFFQKKLTIAQIRDGISRVALGTPGIQEVTENTSDFDPETRTLTITLRAQADEGEINFAEVFTP